MIAPMQIQALQSAYDYFNDELFDGKLSPVMFNFVYSKRSHGYVAVNRWGNRKDETREGIIHELSLTPNTISRPAVDVYGTLVHEMCHIWQIEHGKPSRGGYHNKEWANMMCHVGLTPSNTGQPGGKMTGQNMTHYIEPGGKFERVFNEMPEDFIIPFVAIIPPVVKGKPKGNKTKYTCGHGVSFWGKPNINAYCHECGTKFEPNEV